MKRDDLIRTIALAGEPMGTPAAAAAAGIPPTTEALAAADIILRFSPEVGESSGRWTTSVDTRERRVLDALRAFAEAHPSKRIFRGPAAFAALRPGDHMTESDLRDFLTTTGEFVLLANSMIKRLH